MRIEITLSGLLNRNKKITLLGDFLRFFDIFILLGN